MRAAFRTIIRQFGRDQRGNIAVIFTLCLRPPGHGGRLRDRLLPRDADAVQTPGRGRCRQRRLDREGFAGVCRGGLDDLGRVDPRRASTTPRTFSMPTLPI